jgi:hypothetical protein
MRGLESIEIYTQQGAGNLIQFAKASIDNNEKGKWLKIAYMWWRYTLGIEKCPLQVQEEAINISYLDSIWFKELSIFIQRYKSKWKQTYNGNKNKGKRMNT